jgi:cell division protein ZapA
MASSKNCTEVLIGGKVFNLSGFESEEYLQRVSTYLNHKITECTNIDGYRRQTAETRSTLLALNIADDYFKAKGKGAALEQEIEQKDKEMYDLKHELISTQIKCDGLQQEIEKIKDEKQKLQMQLVKMEVELKNRRR